MVLGALHTCSVISLFDKFKAFDYISISHKSGFFLLFSYKRPYNTFFYGLVTNDVFYWSLFLVLMVSTFNNSQPMNQNFALLRVLRVRW